MAISEGHDEPVFLLGKRNAEFEFKGRQWERTATLKLPRKMTQTEFDAWKESDEVNLIDMYLHCIHQNDPQQKPEPEPPNEELMTDGGSSMPKLALEHLKELDEMDDKIGEWLSEKVGQPIGGMTDLYQSEHSIGEAMNDIELGEGFSVKEPEYIELLTLLDTARERSANNPPSLGVINRLLMQIILANPEEYARVREEMRERAEEAHAEMQRQRNQQRERQRMTDRAADLDGDATDIPLDDEENDERNE